MPRIRRRLARIDPSREACTMRICFATSAIMKMISSTALPKVTFINAPMVSPILPATLSVANDRSAASGIMAIAFMAKTTVGLTIGFLVLTLPMIPKARPTGTKTSSQLTQLEKMILLTSRRKRDHTDAVASGSMAVDASPFPSSTSGGGAGGGNAEDLVSEMWSRLLCS